MDLPIARPLSGAYVIYRRGCTPHTMAFWFCVQVIPALDPKTPIYATGFTMQVLGAFLAGSFLVFAFDVSIFAHVHKLMVFP